MGFVLESLLEQKLQVFGWDIVSAKSKSVDVVSRNQGEGRTKMVEWQICSG